MNKLASRFAALGFAIALGASPALGAPPYTGNTSGTDSAAILATLTDIYSSGFGSVVSVTRVNDTNAYGAGDVIGAATGSTAALTFAVGSSAGQWMITSVALEIDAAAVISGETSYNLDCYSVTPPSALGDNAAWDIPAGDRAAFQGVGEISLGTPIDRGSTLYVEANAVNKQITSVSGNVFCYLVTVGAYTPTASRVYVVTLHTVRM